MDKVKNSYAWKESIELSLDLIRICEEFSDGDHNVLLSHLKNAVVDIPASIASDIKYSRGANLEPVIKLATELELVHRVYPAVDTRSAPEKVQKLLERMESNNFHEQIPAEPLTEPEPEERPVVIKEQPKVEEPQDVESEPAEEPQPESPETPAEQEKIEETEQSSEEAEKPDSSTAPRMIPVNTDNS